MGSTSRSGRRIHYEVNGDGPPLLVQPGIYQDGSHWGHTGYTAALAAEYLVVEIDPLAHGRSAAPVESSAYRLAARAADVIAVLDDIGADTAAYWGYSMGAWVGCGLAVAAPHRLTGLVIGGWDPIGGIEIAYAHARHTLSLPEHVDWSTMLRRSARQQPAQAAVIDAGDPAAFDVCHRSLENQPNLTGALCALDVPLMLYAGDTDPYHDGAREAARQAGAEFRTIAGADHAAAWYDAAAVLAEVVPFLRKAGR